MESSGLRRRDTTKGTPLRILSLDGGGVRGYSMLILLNYFMHLTATKCAQGIAPSKSTVPKPCDYFDLIAGTGTGGLIAIMLGRLRMDTEECMKVYIKMTRKVFETDKTIVGIPYRSTLFKASKLEEAIRECVREYDKERKTSSRGTTPERVNVPKNPVRPESTYSSRSGKSRYSVDGTLSPAQSIRPGHLGRSNAPLYDSRPNRTKTAVTAVLKGNREGTAVLLRSYESPSQPSIEPECTIWEAGRATSATGLAFKPIQIGKSVFLDEGNGKYNPAPQALEEAVQSEWPGRSVGVFLSIGTGKRPDHTSHMQPEWWEGFAGGMGEFAEAKRRLINKIEGCEKTHQDMLNSHLGKKYLSSKNYFRLNVEVGVGEFGMNEWSRLADISNSTNIYLAKSSVKARIESGANAMAEVQALRDPQPYRPKQGPETSAPSKFIPPTDPNIVELAGDEVGSLYPRPMSKAGPQYPASPSHSYEQPYEPQITLVPNSNILRARSSKSDSGVQYESNSMSSSALSRQSEKFSVTTSDERPYRRKDERPHSSDGSQVLPSPRQSIEQYPPPLPPKTPINDPEDQNRRWYSPVPHPPHGRYGNSAAVLPYPDSDGPASRYLVPYPDADGPPPIVNMARKPEYMRR